MSSLHLFLYLLQVNSPFAFLGLATLYPRRRGAVVVHGVGPPSLQFGTVEVPDPWPMGRNARRFDFFFNGCLKRSVFGGWKWYVSSSHLGRIFKVCHESIFKVSFIQHHLLRSTAYFFHFLSRQSKKRKKQDVPCKSTALHRLYLCSRGSPPSARHRTPE